MFSIFNHHFYKNDERCSHDIIPWSNSVICHAGYISYRSNFYHSMLCCKVTVYSVIFATLTEAHSVLVMGLKFWTLIAPGICIMIFIKFAYGYDHLIYQMHNTYALQSIKSSYLIHRTLFLMLITKLYAFITYTPRTASSRKSTMNFSKLNWSWSRSTVYVPQYFQNIHRSSNIRL